MDATRWEQIKEIYSHALDLSLEERENFLAEAWVGDDDLRREVETLLVAHAEAGTFLQAPTIEVAAQDIVTDEFASTAAAESPAAPQLIGRELANYKIISLLGKGGMGVVYEAEQQHPRRLVALKVIRGGRLVDEFQIKLFRREAQALARLKHPGIAAIYEAGCADDDQHYFVMELVRGIPLLDYVKGRRITGSHAPSNIRRRLELFLKICEAISYAHQRGVIHRDLKPANILVVDESDGRGLVRPGVNRVEVKVLDFGLARITDEDGAGASSLSRSGPIRGTLPYMSPEQIRGDSGQIDVRVDVYALGMILYELLAERLPYDLEHVTLPQAIRIICEDDPKPLSRAWGESQDRKSRKMEKIDQDVETIALKALEKEPERRYQSAAAIAADVTRYLAHQPIHARPPSALYQFRKLVARHKTPFAMLAAVFGLLLGFAITMAMQSTRIARERDKAVAAEQMAAEQRDATEKARNAEREQRDAAEQAGAAEQEQRMLAEEQRARAEIALSQAKKERTRAEKRFDDMRKMSNKLVIDLQEQIKGLPGSTQVRAVLLQTAIEYLDNLAKDAGDNPALRRELADAYYRLGDIQSGSMGGSSLGDTKNGLQNHLKALAIRKTLAAATPSDPIAQQDMALSYARVGTLVEGGVDHLREAIRTLERIAIANATNSVLRSNLANCYHNLGLRLTTSGDLAGGLETYGKYLAIMQELSAANPANLIYRGNLSLGHKRVGAILGKQGDIDRALEHYRQAQELDEATVAANPNNLEPRLDLSYSIGDTAYFLRKKGDFVKAMEGYRKVVALREPIVAADPANMRAHGSLASAYMRLGTVSADAGYLTNALESCRKALTLSEKISAIYPIYVADANHSLGYVYGKLASDQTKPVVERLAHWRNARSYYQRCLDIMLDLRKRGALSEVEADDITTTIKDIARCDAEIEKLEGG
jgi:eukaryotic-like serine/threonine-protein kinase